MSCGIFFGDRPDKEQSIGARRGRDDLGDPLLYRAVAADLGRISYANGVRDMAKEEAKVVLESKLTCPSCGHVEPETMPKDACQWFYECKSCQAVLKPLEGDCRV